MLVGAQQKAVGFQWVWEWWVLANTGTPGTLEAVGLQSFGILVSDPHSLPCRASHTGDAPRGSCCCCCYAVVAVMGASFCCPTIVK